MRVGIVSDLHLPFAHPLYLKFCQDTFDSWGVGKVVFIGDVVEAHALSRHELHQDAMSAESEADAAQQEIDRWYAAFPKALVCVGNHDARHFRKAASAGIPTRYVKGYADVYGTPKWDWQQHHTIDGVLYEHGTGSSGKDAALNRAMLKMTNLVMGHTHVYAGVKFHACESRRIFALNVGCGINVTDYCFAYSKDFPNRPVLGCGVVIDGEVPHFIPMPCGAGEKYSKRRRKAK